MVESWRFWAWSESNERWEVLGEGITERAALDAGFALRPTGDVLCLPFPADPNSPRLLEREEGRGRHHGGGRSRGSEAVAVIRGQHCRTSR